MRPATGLETIVKNRRLCPGDGSLCLSYLFGNQSDREQRYPLRPLAWHNIV